MSIQRHRVLIIEDESDVASLMCGVLEDEGYEVLLQRNGDCAHLVHTVKPDVILCDYMLPLHDGQAVLRHVRNECGWTGPFIMVSAAAYAACSWREWGADDFLAKPFDIDRLVAVVDRAVGNDGMLWSRPASDDGADEQAS